MIRCKALFVLLGFSCLIVSCLKSNVPLIPLELKKDKIILLQTKINFNDNQNELAKEAEGKIVVLISDFQSLLDRHPDFDLTKERILLKTFRASNFLEQASQFNQFEEAYKTLEKNLMHKILQPNDEKLTTPDILNYKTFTPNGFKFLYEHIKHEQLEDISESPVITGDELVDKHIRSLAIARGYLLRSKTESAKLTKIDGIYLQPEVAEAYRQLKNEALKYDMRLGILSGFRSVEAQRTYFVKVFKESAVRKLGRVYTKAEIIAGKADSLLSTILETTSIPGFSKHHSGYAVDFIEANSNKLLVGFASTPIYSWLIANNFYNAKRFGFIPSYPEGATAQGPLPEPWEYVWVGTGVLKR